MPPPPTYPTILTATDWNKKKGIVAKVLAVPTKLGDELRKAEEAYKAVKWAEMSAAPHVSATANDVNDKIALVGIDRDHDLGNVSKALKEVKAHANEVKAEWAHSKVVPNDAKKHLDLLIAAIDPFINQYKDEIAGILKKLETLRNVLVRLNPHQAVVVGTGRIEGKGANNDPVVVGLKARKPVAPAGAAAGAAPTAKK